MKECRDILAGKGSVRAQSPRAEPSISLHFALHFDPPQFTPHFTLQQRNLALR